MAQLKTFSWVNPATAVARNQSVGFAVARVQTIDVTAGGSWMWAYGMPNGYYITLASGAVTTSNGFTPLSEQALFGAPITAVTKGADTVFTCSFLDQFEYFDPNESYIGSTIKVNGIADDGSGTSLNGTYTIKSLSATQITCEESTASGYSVYVSGGFAVKNAKANGEPYPTENVAIQGGTLGTGMVGGNASAMVAIFEGQNSVV